MVHAFTHWALSLVTRTASSMASAVGSGKSMSSAYNDALWEVVRVSNAHCFLVILRSFLAEIDCLDTNREESNLIDQSRIDQLSKGKKDELSDVVNMLEYLKKPDRLDSNIQRELLQLCQLFALYTLEVGVDRLRSFTLIVLF